METSIEFTQTSIEGRQGKIRKKMSTEVSHRQSENKLMMGKKFPEMHPGNLNIKWSLSVYQPLIINYLLLHCVPISSD